MRIFAILILSATPFAAMPVGAEAPPDLAAQLCEGRPGCKSVKLFEAGRDRAGRRLRVVELSLGEKAKADGRRCRPYAREFWVVAGAGSAAKATRLMSLCNDGYGAAGVGDDTVTVKPNRVIYKQSGGSNWRWSNTRSIRLDPLQVLSERRCSYWNVAPGFSVDQWNWRRFRGLTMMRFQPRQRNDKDELGCIPAAANHQYLAIPNLIGTRGLTSGGPVTVGSCGILLRDDGSAGFMVYGRPGPAGGASTRLVLIGNRDLLITVDDRKIEGGRRWVDSDHIEIWQAGIMSIGTNFLTSKSLVQFGVRLVDGKVFAAYGKPKKRPVVVSHRMERLGNGRSRVSLHLRLPRDANAITVVYSKTVEGRQSRMVATSPIRYGKVKSLGGVFPVSPKQAVCAIRDGRLDLVRSGDIKALGE